MNEKKIMKMSNVKKMLQMQSAVLYPYSSHDCDLWTEFILQGVHEKLCIYIWFCLLHLTVSIILKFVYCCISIVTIKKWHLITRKLHFILNTLYSPLSPNHTSLRGTGHMKFFSLWERVDVTSKAFYCYGILDKYTLLYTRWCFSDAVVEYLSLGEASTDSWLGWGMEVHCIYNYMVLLVSGGQN